MTALVVDAALAARIERAEAEFMVACTGSSAGAFVSPVGSGFATYAGVDSPFTKIIGVGFGDDPDDALLDEVERRHAAVGATVSYEISTVADPVLVERLGSRGYRVVSFEDVLVRDVAGDDVAGDLPEASPGVDVVRAEDQVRTWLDVAVDSALHPDDAGVPQHDTFPREALEAAETAALAAGARLYLARVDGRPAGAASIRFADGIAQMTGAGTLPDLRRRGVQRALLRARLQDAQEAGCDIAVVTTQPGSTSEANVRRLGFELAYVRAVLQPAP